MYKRQGLVKYVEKFREEGYIGAQITAKEIAETLQIVTKFQEKRVGKKRKLSDYEGEDMANKDLPSDEKYKIDFFYPIVDTILTLSLIHI